MPALHGGVVGALMEVTALTQLAIASKSETFPKTIDIGIDYLRSGRPLDTYARARVVKIGRRIANVQAEAWQNERSQPIAALHGHFKTPGEYGVSSEVVGRVPIGACSAWFAALAGRHTLAAANSAAIPRRRERAETSPMTRTIMLIHGAWLNSKSWEHWKRATRPRASPSSRLTGRATKAILSNSRRIRARNSSNTAPKDIVAHYAENIRALPEAPIVIGHSAGGVFTLHLLDQGLGVAGVAIDPAPTPGVGIPIDGAISALPVLGDPFSGGKVISMMKQFFADRFANGLPRDQVDDHFERYVVPTAGKVYWDGVISGGARSHHMGQRSPRAACC